MHPDAKPRRAVRFAPRLAAFAALLGLAAPLCAQAPQWRPYSYPADGFSAAFPVQPALEKKTIATSAGSFELRSYQALDGSVALIVSVCDYGSQAAGKDPATMLQGAKNGALENTKSHLVSEKKITLGASSGLEYEAENEEAHSTVRMYLVGTTLYQVVVVSPLNQPYAQSTRFLDSFALIPKTSN